MYFLIFCIFFFHSYMYIHKFYCLSYDIIYFVFYVEFLDAVYVHVTKFNEFVPGACGKSSAQALETPPKLQRGREHPHSLLLFQMSYTKFLQ